MQRSSHLQQTTSRKLSAERLLADWRVICEKLPKGFEKYFQDKPSKSADPSSSSSSSSSSQSSTSTQKAKNEKSAPPKSNDWSLGMFSPSSTKSGRSSGSGGGSGGGGGSGKPLGGEDNDKEKWLMFGAVSALAIAGAIVYFEVGYKEIGWKEFVNK